MGKVTVVFRTLKNHEKIKQPDFQTAPFKADLTTINQNISGATLHQLCWISMFAFNPSAFINYFIKPRNRGVCGM